MDHAVYPIEKVWSAFAHAMAANPDHEAGLRTAANALGITVEAVREVVETTTSTNA